MFHARLSRDPRFSFLIGSKEPGRNIDVAKRSDVLFICLRHEDVAGVIKEVRVIPKPPPLFTTASRPWPLEIAAEQYLFWPIVYGLIGKGTHVLLDTRGTQSPSVQAVIESLHQCVGNVETFSDLGLFIKRGIEAGIVPALIASEALRMKTHCEFLDTAAFNRISAVSEVPVERIRTHMPLMHELVTYFNGDLQKIIDFVATKGGMTEKMIKELSTL